MIPFALLIAMLPLAAQTQRLDSVRARVTVTLAGGDPVAGSWTYRLAGAPRRPGPASGHTWDLAARVDTRLPPTYIAARPAGEVVLYGPGLSSREVAVVTRALARGPSGAGSQAFVLGAVPDSTAPVAGASLAERLEPAAPVVRHLTVLPQAPRIPEADRHEEITLMLASPGGLAAGDTIWVVIADRGTRRWVTPVVLPTTAARPPVAAIVDTAAVAEPLRTDVPIVFAVRQQPGDVRTLRPGFSVASQGTGGGAAATGGVDAGLIAAVRRFGITALHVAMPRSGRVRVLDLSGRELATIGPETLQEGYWTMRWDGTRTDGSRVPPGVYLAVTEALGAQVITRLIVTQ